MSETEHTEFYNIIVRGVHSLEEHQRLQAVDLLILTFELSSTDACMMLSEAIAAGRKGEEKFVLCSFTEPRWAAVFCFQFRMITFKQWNAPNVHIAALYDTTVPEGVLCRITEPTALLHAKAEGDSLRKARWLQVPM